MDSEMVAQQGVLRPEGRGASVHGTEPEEEDDDEYMSLDRESLDLDFKCDISRAASPAPSYLSMASDGMDTGESGIETDASQPGIELERPNSSVSSIYSLESDEGADDDLKPELALERRSKNQKISAAKPELYIHPDYKRHPALTVKFMLKLLPQLLKQLNEAQLRFFKKYLWERYPEFFRDPLDVLDILDVSDKMVECCDLERAINITRHILLYMQANRIAHYMDQHLHRNEVRYALKQELKAKYGKMYEGGVENVTTVDFESAYTELFMTEGRFAGANLQHELRGEVEKLRLEARSLNKMKPKKIDNLYDPKEVEDRYTRLVILRGITGIGKTTAMQRFILDWCNDKTHEEIFFIFPLSGRDLIGRLDEEITWRELLAEFYPSSTQLAKLEFDDCRVMYIFDDTDEMMQELDFVHTFCFVDQDTKIKLRKMIINLVRGNLQCHAFVMMITPPIASCRIPNDKIHQVCEIRGFSDEDRYNYFRNRYRTEPAIAERFVTYLKANPMVFIMCYHPLFCWVLSQAMEKVFRKFPPGKEPPSTLTEVYCHLLKVCLNKREDKRRVQEPGVKDKSWEDEKTMVMKLGKWAFTMLEKEDFEAETAKWKDEECHGKEAILRSGICTEYWRQAFILYNEKWRAFINPSVQEFMAALYIMLNFKNHSKNLLDTSKMSMIKIGSVSLAELYKCAVDRMANSKAELPCHWDLFTRFLVGLGSEYNQRTLDRLFNNVGFKASHVEDAAKAIKKKMKEYPDHQQGLEKCLQELHPAGQKCDSSKKK
ncbi:protein NLRC3 [Engraulis encrasicolus]|uniref:protein NLRC3 n=1 Tax=Engraulis encrasicolus TaxID=184585 RepID=UPI002FD08704